MVQLQLLYAGVHQENLHSFTTAGEELIYETSENEVGLPQ